ncbi:unnamed protein product [Tilletia controversa]|nr:unnamed protein product [Tilletia controversa]
MATKRAKSAPRCNKGCTDPDDPTQKALKAQCACSRKRSSQLQVLRVTDRGGESSAVFDAASTIAAVDRLLTETAAQAAQAAAELDVQLSMPSFARTPANAIQGADVDPPSPAPTSPAAENDNDALNNETNRESHVGNIEGEALPAADQISPEVAAGAGVENGLQPSAEDNANAEDDEDQTGPMKDSEQHHIWYNLGNAHDYAVKNFKREPVAKKRSKILNRSLWRVIKSAADLSARTDTAMFLAWATLEPGKQKHKQVVWASENICDPARPVLHSMTRAMHDKFHADIAVYRENQVAEAARHAAEKATWQAERIELLSRIAELQHNRADGEGGSGSSSQL